MGVLGSDPAQLDALKMRLTRIADEVQTERNQLDSALRSTWWQGNDADRFRDTWDTQHRSAMDRVVMRLRNTADEVAEAARRQRQASGA